MDRGLAPKKTRSRRINVQLTAPALEGRGWFYPYRASGRHPDHRHSCRDRDSVLPEQKGKAQDSSAKTQAASAQTAMETYATDHNGSYEGASVAELQAIEPTLKDKTTAELKEATGKGSEEYTVKSEAVGSKNTFTIKMKSGEVE